MKSVSSFIIILAVGVFCTMATCKQNARSHSLAPVIPATPVAVALAGNGYITREGNDGTAMISNEGLSNWTSLQAVTSVYFKPALPGKLSIGVRAKVMSTDSSSIKLTVNGSAFTIRLSGDGYKTYFAGTVDVAAAGYVKVDLQGVSKSGAYFADVSDIMIGGASVDSNTVYANDPANYYWSRRGPSCHLKYKTPAEEKEYFYSELTVPAGEDKVGTYFMANGFGEGYFGIQVNSLTERRVLFSVWDPSAGSTTLERKGPGVTAGRFGGEGTGGQSYLIFNWKAATTYRFLTKGKPDGAGNTVYTSWFFAPEAGNWKLLATFKRPHTSKYLTGFHGFIENFYPEQGYLGRKAYWSDQWVRTVAGTWKEVNEFIFTADATAANKQRSDYAGGVENGKFFLQNCGFFNSKVNVNTVFTRPLTNAAPSIDFDSLP